METTRDRRHGEQIVVDVTLVVIEDDDSVLEHTLHIFLSVKIKPVFETETTELMEHLLLLEEVNLLSFLLVAFLVEANVLEKQVLANLLHWLGHQNFTTELRMHGDEGRAVELLKS